MYVLLRPGVPTDNPAHLSIISHVARNLAHHHVSLNMPIDLTQEQGLALRIAAKLIPSPITGEASHVSRLIRLITKGTRRPDGKVVYLGGAKFGGSWVTTVEAIRRYCEEMAVPVVEAPAVSAQEPGSSKASRKKSRQATARALDEIGIR